MAFIISTEYESIAYYSLRQTSLGNIILHIFLLYFPSQYLHINRLTNTGGWSKL